MDSTLLKTAIIYMLAAMAGAFSAPLQAQDADAGRTISPSGEGDRMVTPYRSHAEFALDMFLDRMQGRGLDVDLDPDEYIIGAGDLFGIYFVSGDISNISCRVSPEGRLFIKSVGSIDVGGLTLREAIDKIAGAVDKNYAGSEFEIQMTDFRFTRINIIGEVTRPGLYYVPAVWRASEAIDLAGGITTEASLRHIVLRGDKDEYPVDLVRFNAIGNAGDNPFVCKGNSLLVPRRQASDKYVSVAGRVGSPGIFEAAAGDRLADYIAYAHGIEGDPADIIAVISSQNGAITNRLDCSDPTTLDFVPAPGDNLALVWKDGRENFGHVVIMGAVARPGRYPIGSGNFSLSDLLALSGGIAPDGCFERIRIFRRTRGYFNDDFYGLAAADLSAPNRAYANEGNGSAGYHTLSYNPRKPLDPSQLNLIKGDSLYVPRATGIVSVSGAVVSPGLIRFDEGQGVEYYLKQAGGLGIDADRERIVVINPVTGGGIGADKAGQLFDGEMLFVPRKEYGTKP